MVDVTRVVHELLWELPRSNANTRGRGKERNSVGKDVAPIEAERRKSKNLGIPYPL